ncbi:MAG TPA: 50S ribosomal protein L6 [candidate division Zixibacteria bacterium]|nr:50S ribosomal protein L6 [candidate division Zixibacteria bacterium]
MSRIGYNPLTIPDGVKVEFKDNVVAVSGPKGELSCELGKEVGFERNDDGTITITRINDLKRPRQMHGLYRSLVENMLIGVSEGFVKDLEVIGVGYKVEQHGRGMIISLGYSHQIFFLPPEGVTVTCDTPKRKTQADGTPNQLLAGFIKVEGADKQLVGQVAAKIRSLKVPDVYKSKGIRYADERVSIKAGKAAT